LARAAKTLLSLGAPDSFRCARLAYGELSALGSRRRRTAINHRTVRWCTGLSGEPTVGRANGRPRNPRVTHGQANGQKGAPDYPVCTRQCPVRQRLQIVNGRPSQRSAAQSTCDAWPSQRSEGGTGLSGVHQTVSGAPTAPNRQRSATPEQERNLHRTVSGGAPDCPVHQSTEGKNCLPGLLSTAPNCLGAIKGTPRRMKEYTKHSLIISKHQDISLAHLICCDSNVSSS
jgi:hypothetical protein